MSKHKLSEVKTPAEALLEQYHGDFAAATEALLAAVRGLAAQAPADGPELAAPPKAHPKGERPDTPVLVEVKDLERHYRIGKNPVNAVNGVSLAVHEGEILVITGPSGSGKSSVLQLMGGLDRPDAGSVAVAGQDLAKLSDPQLSQFRNQTVGFVFQFFYLQPFLTLRRNLEVPGMFSRLAQTERTARITELAEAVGLSDRLEHLPRELSGGQMQRAAIARALLNHPKLLLADEPTGNLDRTNARAIIELFGQIREKYGTTVVIVTHDPEVAASADRVIKLEDGVIV